MVSGQTIALDRGQAERIVGNVSRPGVGYGIRTFWYGYLTEVATSDGDLLRYWFWAIPVIVLLAIVIRLALHGSRTQESANWATTEATIFTADVQESNAFGGWLYSAAFVYSYSAGGEYLSGKVTVPSSSEDEAELPEM